MPPVSPARLTLPDRYRVVRHLASGGMAGVWEAHDQLLGRSVAVKVLASHLARDDRARRRFEREARAAAGLSSHPHVVTIYDVGDYDGRTFIVMELMSGGSVADRLRDGGVPRVIALRWLREAASALDAAHEAGVVHRDVKPANLLLDRRDRLAIADFGIARLAFEDQVTATGQVLGTAAYISPEQAVGEPATTASDRYALAVVAFELLTGMRPFRGEHFAAQARAHVEDDPPRASERDPALPRDVDGVLERGMAKEPEDRWETATGMVDALERAAGAADRPTEATRVAGGVPPRGGPRRRTAAAVIGGLVALLAAAALAFALLSGGDGGGGDDERPQTASEEPRQEQRQEPRQEQREEQRPERRQERRQSTPAPEPTAEATPTATATAAPTATATAPPAPQQAPSGLAAARRLQLQGYNARLAGDYEQALQLSQQALEACGDARQLDPCGYAAFEVGVALTELGRAQEAIPFLEQRLSYGDNGEAREALEAARSQVEGGGNRGRGNGGQGAGGD